MNPLLGTISRSSNSPGRRWGAAVLALVLVASGLLLPGASSAQDGASVVDDGSSGPEASPLAGANQDKVDSIRQKQKDIVEDTCGALQEFHLLTAAEPALPDTPDVSVQCDVAARNAEDVSDTEIQAMAAKRDARAEGFSEYTGPNRNVGDGDAPSWNPGDQTLEGVEYLGKDYEEDGDGDGICNPKGGGPKVDEPDVEAGQAGKHGSKLTGYSEWCAEVVGDGIGDDDGFCERQNPQGKEKSFDEPCVPAEVTLDDVDANDENFDSRRLDDYDALLTTTQASAQQFRQTTSAVVAGYRSNQAIRDAMSAAGASRTCAEVTDRLGDAGLIALGVISGVAEGAKTASEIAGNFFGQTIVVVGTGGNTKAAAIVPASLAGALMIVAQALEVTADVDTSMNVNATLECMNVVGGLVKGLAEVKLEVIELQAKSRYLVSATFSGRPMAGVRFTSVKVASSDGLDFSALTADQFDTRELPGAPGTYELILDLPSALKSSQLFIFDVEGDPPADSEFTDPINGHVVFDRRSPAL